jgi:hypothetical protein
MKKLFDIALDLTACVSFCFDKGVNKFLCATLQITDPAATFETEKGTDGKYLIKTSDGIWKAWSKIIGGDFIAYCESPGGIVHDHKFVPMEHNGPSGKFPGDCGHKVSQKPQLCEIERHMH